MKPPRITGPKLGELLEARGRIDREALFKAMRHQRAAGGRIGTCLLELDLVAEDELLSILSEQAKLPFVEADALRSIPEDTIRLVPAKVARARRAIPVRSSGSQLYVAMIDPHDIAAQDELSFVSGRRVRPQVATEVRIYEALARYYGVDIPARFVKLLDRMNRARYLWTEGTPDAGAPQPPGAAGTPTAAPPTAPAVPAPMPTAAAATPAPPVAEPPSAPPPAVAEPEPAASAPEIATQPAEIQPPVPIASLSLEQAEKRLNEPAGRDAVADLLIEFARSRAAAALLLMVRRDEATGWRGSIPGRDDAAVHAYRLSLAQASLVLALREGVPYYRGPLPPLTAHGPLAELLGDAARGEILGLPLRVRQRMVAVLIVAGGETPLSPATVDELRRLANKASMSLELLVLRQKLQQG